MATKKHALYLSRLNIIQGMLASIAARLSGDANPVAAYLDIMTEVERINSFKAELENDGA